MTGLSTLNQGSAVMQVLSQNTIDRHEWDMLHFGFL
jgi:hypothetical protein